jgi:hypothetical protein
MNTPAAADIEKFTTEVLDRFPESRPYASRPRQGKPFPDDHTSYNSKSLKAPRLGRVTEYLGIGTEASQLRLSIPRTKTACHGHRSTRSLASSYGALAVLLFCG